MITKTDRRIFNFVDDFHIVTSKQIFRMFYPPANYRGCMDRLDKLCKRGELKKTRSAIDNCYAYFLKKKPVQVMHDLLRAELFVALKEKYKVLSWQNEEPVMNIRPDALAYVQNSAFAYIDDHGIKFPVFIEIHLNNKFNFDKYINMEKETDLLAAFGLMPRVIICTDRQIVPPTIGIKFKVVGLDMSGLDTIFK